VHTKNILFSSRLKAASVEFGLQMGSVHATRSKIYSLLLTRSTVTLGVEFIVFVISGAGTNLKVGERGGALLAHRSGIFLAVQIQLVVLVSTFMMVNTVWSVSCLLLSYSQCPMPSHL